MTTKNKKVYDSDLAIPPGEYLADVINELGISKQELAHRMDRPASKLSQIFNGEKAITPETALQLERVVGVPAHIWTGLEAEYRLILARQKEAELQEQLKQDTSLVSKYCYSELVRLGRVKKFTKPIEKVKALLDFFGVASLAKIQGIGRYQTAFRCGNGQKRSSEALAAWLRMGELSAQQISCNPFNGKKLSGLLNDLRAMTLQFPDTFLAPLKVKLADVGVAFVLCPHLPKTYAHGATFWLGKEKAVLMMSNRGKWADIFWFSLYHEIGHILLHGNQSIFVEGDDVISPVVSKEEEANIFAADSLIPPEKYRQFKSGHSYGKDDVLLFAQELAINPGIVVGRLHHEKLLRHDWLNGLRTQYEW